VKYLQTSCPICSPSIWVNYSQNYGRNYSQNFKAYYFLLITAKIGFIISWPKQRLKLWLVSAEWVSIFGRDKSKSIQLVKRSFCRSFLAIVLFFNQFIVMKTFLSNYVLNFTLKFFEIISLFIKIFTGQILFMFISAIIFGKNCCVTLKTKFYCQIRVFTLIPNFFITQQFWATVIWQFYRNPKQLPR